MNGPINEESETSVETLAVVQTCWREVSSDSGLALAPEDDLFEQGVDSFSFIALIRRVEERFQVSLPLLQIFENPRLTTVVAAVEMLQERS